MNAEEIKGKANQVKGAIKENLGWLTDDYKAEDEGKDQRAEGRVQEHDAKAHREAEEAEQNSPRA